MSDRALVLSVDLWEMADEKTGEIRRGASVWYVNDYREDSATGLGFKPTKVSATTETFNELKMALLPAVFDLDFGSRPGQQNKAQLTLVRATHVHNVDLFADPQTAAAPAKANGSGKSATATA